IQLDYQHDVLNVGWSSHYQAYWLQPDDPDSTWYKFIIRVRSKFGSTDTTFVDSIYVERYVDPGPQIVLDSFEVYDPSGELTEHCIYDDPDRFWATVIDVRDAWYGDSVFIWLREGQDPQISAYFTKDTTEMPIMEYYGQQHTDDLDTIYFKVTAFPSGLGNGSFVDLLQLQMLVHPDPFNVPDTFPWEFPWEVSHYNQRLYWNKCSTPCTPPCPSPPGCPMLYSWDGSEYVLENNLLPQSEETDRPPQDFTDVFMLDFAHPDQAQQYRFQIVEDETEESRFRRFKVFALDIPQGVTKLVLDNQLRLGFLTGNAVNPITAVTHEDEDILELLAEADNAHFVSDVPGYIDLKYVVGKRQTNRMSLGSTPGGGIDPPPPDKNHGKVLYGDGVRAGPNVYIIQAQNENGEYEVVGKRHARRRQLRRPFDLSDYVADGVLHARLVWTQRIELDHLPYLHYNRLDVRPRRMRLVEAVHSDSGDVLSELSETSSGYVSLQPGERLDLCYQAPPLADSLQRLLLFRAVGRYEAYTPPIDKMAESLPERFTFNQNYPNPFNPSTTFNFALPRYAHVTLCVYNVLGQKVATVINQNYPSGRHSYEWNGEDGRGQTLSSGVYFARFVAGEFASTKKMVVVK
ncbi:MAG: T9SS type A sorting domain-containing protein, partial [candidate division Zixibacteria bacterium]|nr:T9SS type A sorting domain-containing protein [candidate division Zixibacteria bacterium]